MMENNKITQILSRIIFFIYVFLSIYETYIREIIGSITRFYLIVFLIFLLLNARRKPFSSSQLIIAIWLSFYYISLLWTPNLQQAYLYMGTITAMAFSAILCENCYFPRNVVKDVVSMYKWCSVSMAILGIFFSEPFILDNSPRMVLTLGGIQSDPNNLVAMYAIGSGLTLFSLRKGNPYKVVNMLGLLACIYCILISGSRSGVLILGLQFLIWIFYVNREMNLVLRFVVLSLFIFVTGYIMYTYVNLETVERLLGQGDLAFTDSTGRDALWGKALRVFSMSPIIGNGWGACPAHNTFLTFLVDVGIIGAGLIVIYIFRLFLKVLKYKDVGALAIFLPGLIQSFLIDAQNKRFFWNIMIMSILIINSYENATIDTKFTTNSQR